MVSLFISTWSRALSDGHRAGKDAPLMCVLQFPTGIRQALRMCAILGPFQGYETVPRTTNNSAF